MCVGLPGLPRTVGLFSQPERPATDENRVLFKQWLVSVLCATLLPCLLAHASLLAATVFSFFFLFPWSPWWVGQAALFNFQSLLTVLLLMICTCAYVHHIRPQLLDSHKTGYRGLFWKLARIGIFGEARRGGTGEILRHLSVDPFSDPNSFRSSLLRAAGERLSPVISLGCLLMAINVLFITPKQ